MCLLFPQTHLHFGLYWGQDPLFLFNISLSDYSLLLHYLQHSPDSGFFFTLDFTEYLPLKTYCAVLGNCKITA